MPAAAVMAVSAAASAYAANQQKKGAKGAANAVRDAQQGQYQQTRADLMPFMDFGKQAIGGLGALNAGDFSGFASSPDYLFAMQQGIGNLDKSAASRGSLFSGGHERDLSQFNQGLAGQFLNQYRNSLFNQAQMGQNAAAQTGQFGANAATNTGNALAGMYQQRADTNSQLAGGLAGLFGNYMGQRAGGGASSYAAPSSGSYTGLGGQASLAQPQFGNNYGSFGNFGFNWDV